MSKSTSKIKAFIESFKYEVFFCGIHGVSLSQFAWAFLVMPEDFEPHAAKWVYYVISVMALFLADLVLHFIVYGFRATLMHRDLYIIEILVQLSGWYCITSYWFVSYLTSINTIDFLCILMLIRTLRLLSYMTEIRHFDQIFHTFKNF